jgi:DNA-binding transcriptional ArsR family regulator
MSISLMTDVWRLPLQATRKMVLLALADNANDEGTDCWPSIGKLVEKCSMSERAIQGHLAALEESGYIKRHERLGRSNKFTIYVDRIRFELFQKSKSNSRTLADSATLANIADRPPQILHP